MVLTFWRVVSFIGTNKHVYAILIIPLTGIYPQEMFVYKKKKKCLCTCVKKEIGVGGVAQW